MHIGAPSELYLQNIVHIEIKVYTSLYHEFTYIILEEAFVSVGSKVKEIVDIATTLLPRIQVHALIYETAHFCDWLDGFAYKCMHQIMRV